MMPVPNGGKSTYTRARPIATTGPSTTSSIAGALGDERRNSSIGPSTALASEGKLSVSSLSITFLSSISFAIVMVVLRLPAYAIGTSEEQNQRFFLIFSERRPEKLCLPCLPAGRCKPFDVLLIIMNRPIGRWHNIYECSRLRKTFVIQYSHGFQGHGKSRRFFQRILEVRRQGECGSARGRRRFGRRLRCDSKFARDRYHYPDPFSSHEQCRFQ